MFKNENGYSLLSKNENNDGYMDPSSLRAM